MGGVSLSQRNSPSVDLVDSTNGRTDRTDSAGSTDPLINLAPISGETESAFSSTATGTNTPSSTDTSTCESTDNTGTIRDPDTDEDLGYEGGENPPTHDVDYDSGIESDFSDDGEHGDFVEDVMWPVLGLGLMTLPSQIRPQQSLGPSTSGQDLNRLQGPLDLYPHSITHTCAECHQPSAHWREGPTGLLSLCIACKPDSPGPPAKKLKSF